MTATATESGAAKTGADLVLEVRDGVKRYGAVEALRGVSLSVRRGQVLGLIGDNGAGKSTMVKAIAGSIDLDEGEILVDGEERKFKTPADAREVGIETVFQTLSLISTLDMTENIWLNREHFRFGALGRRLQLMDKRRMRERVAQGFKEMGLELPDQRTKLAALSGGQRQSVAIARAVLWGSHIVVLDEPAAALGVRQTEIVLSFIERLRSRGVAVVFISHNMEHVLRVSDEIACLRLGRCVHQGPRAELDGQRLVALITGAA